jgi:hypothetical protein
MKRILLAAVLAVSLAACGQGGGQPEATAGPSCELLSNAERVFGRGMIAQSPQRPIDGASGECAWESEDGRVLAQLVLFDAGGQAKFDETVQSWVTMTNGGAEAQALEGIGDGASLVTPMPGYQAQIAVRKGERLALILANSGDDALTSEALARKMAEAIAPNL